MKANIVSLLVIACLSIGSLQAQDKDTSVYLKKMFYRGNDSMPYRILLPHDFDLTKKYPLVLFLHGRGESGNDNVKQLSWGSRQFVKDPIRKKYPAIVVFPQCSENGYWSNVIRTPDGKSGRNSFKFRSGGEPTRDMDMLMSLLGELISTYPVDSSRQYAMGLSMGGMGTFEIVRRMPNTFAAAIPIAGGADTASAGIIKNTPFWIFHGAEDDVVPFDFSADMVKAMQRFYSAGEMQFTLYPGTGHNSWEKAFAEPELLSWLFSQRKMK